MVQTKPLPWIARENSVEVRLAHGLRGGEQMTRFSGSWALLLTKALHWGAVGTLDADGQNFIGGEVKFKF